MTTQVIVSDYVVERRMSFVLDHNDFAAQQQRWQQSDGLLSSFRDHPFFAGCEQWNKLEIKHFHALIINIINICGDHPDGVVGDKAHPTVSRLLFLLCSLITVLEQRTRSKIDLFRVNRVRKDDVLYDYSARLDVIVSPPRTALRIVIDNED